MGADFHIDVDTLKMFAGEDWHPLGADCPHDCPHNAASVIGWGPTLATYELDVCDLCGCRSWIDGRWQKARERGENSGFWWSRRRWQVPVLTDQEDP